MLHLSLVKFQQEWSQGVHSGAVWRIRKKMPQTRCQKLPQWPLRKKRGSPNFVWRQFIISQTMHCHGSSAMWPPCYLPWILPVYSGRHVGQVRHSCNKLVLWYNDNNGHLFYVGGDLMMRRDMLPIIMLPDGDLRIALHLVPFWILTIWGSVHIEETVVGWHNQLRMKTSAT